MKRFAIWLLLIIALAPLYAKDDYNEHNPRQLITLSQNLRMEDALRAIEAMTQQYEGKKVVNVSTYAGPINIDINLSYYRDALKIITQYNGLVLEELPGSFLIKDKPVEEKKDDKLGPDAPQIRISGIFFKADRSFERNLGIDWSTVASGKVVTSINMSGATNLTDNMMQATVGTSVDAGEYTIDINTLLKVLEDNQKGKVIARPSLTVLSGKEGYIQVGEDFSVKTKDEAGNVSDQFFSTGIIMRVYPTVVEKDGKKAIYIKTTLEKSSATPGELTTIIRKNQSDTEVMLYDGEETVIGGLYETETTKERGGVPFLKDLPPWFFGLCYLFGFEKNKEDQSEMIVVLKAQLIEDQQTRKNNAAEVQDQLERLRQGNDDAKKLMMALPPTNGQEGH